MEETPEYIGAAWESSQDFTMGQGFAPMSRDGLILVSNREWDLRCVFWPQLLYCPGCNRANQPFTKVDQADVVQKKILSIRAMSKIKKDTCDGRYIGRKDAVEPPLMAPSYDPADYSRVRTGVVGAIGQC